MGRKKTKRDLTGLKLASGPVIGGIAGGIAAGPIGIPAGAAIGTGISFIGTTTSAFLKVRRKYK